MKTDESIVLTMAFYGVSIHDFHTNESIPRDSSCMSVLIEQDLSKHGSTVKLSEVDHGLSSY